ncbi:MAG: RNA methyltransferase [Clostridia bacterium]|nr:RNA methyltransferase [Clostridia bacterium]
MIKEITSTKNQKYKYIKSLKTKKARMSFRQYTVEGIKSVNDAILAGADIDFIVVSDKLQGSFDFENMYVMPETIFEGLCDTETPQGVLAVINMPKQQKADFEESLYLLCDRVTDPGNMGTIIRICDAVGCGLLLSEGTVDIYNPKTVRASMGSFFHTKVTDSLTTADIQSMKDSGFKLLCGALSDNTVDFRNADYSGKTIIVVGNEANGISEEILKMSDCCIKVPIWGAAESLNVGVAAALLLYETRRKEK